jgi:hypothetical protein
MKRCILDCSISNRITDLTVFVGCVSEAVVRGRH